MEIRYEIICKRLGKWLNVKVRDNDWVKIKKALELLNIDATPEDTRSAAQVVGIMTFIFCSFLILILYWIIGFSILWFIFLSFPALLYMYLKKYPILKAESEGRYLLSQTPEVMGYIIMSLRINPNLEKSIEFAALHSSGTFNRLLGRVLLNVQTGAESTEKCLSRIGEKVGEKSEEFKRSMNLVLASVLEKTEDGRCETLGKASQVLLEGLAERTEREARAMNTPVMIVFTFGIILPLVFVAVIPFISFMGINVGISTIAIIYTIGLPLILFFLIKFIASSRPIIIVPVNLPSEKYSEMYIIISVVIGILLILPILLGEKIFGAMEYLPAIWGFSAGTGSFLLLTSLKGKRTREKIRKLEANFGEMLHHLGVLLSEGRSIEDALQKSSSNIFRSAAKNIRIFNTDIKSAFFDDSFGSLREIYSGNIRGIIDTLTSLSDKGSDSIAKVAFSMSKHMANLKKSETEIERNLGSIISSMRIIAMFVAPLVGGMISSMSIVLNEAMTKSQSVDMSLTTNLTVMDASLVTIIICIYIVESAIILTIFGVDLMNGNDRVIRRYNTGIALILSVFVFTICAWISSGLFGGVGIS